LPLFITFEGPEGSGKSTQARLLGEHLQQDGVSVILTREPGGTRVGEKVRSILLDLANTDICPVTEALLYLASRAQLVHEVIRPSLDSCDVVVCDRFADSTFAYQGYGNGLDLLTLRSVNEFAAGGLHPDLTFYLDLPVKVGLERKKGPDVEWTRLDAKEVVFHERVRSGYLQMAAAEPARWVLIDATLPVDEIRRLIFERTLSTLKTQTGGGRTAEETNR
jgi:dTMP kinase